MLSDAADGRSISGLSCGFVSVIGGGSAMRALGWTGSVEPDGSGTWGMLSVKIPTSGVVLRAMGGPTCRTHIATTCLATSGTCRIAVFASNSSCATSATGWWVRGLHQARCRYGLCVFDYQVTSHHAHLVYRDRGKGEIAASMQLLEGCLGHNKPPTGTSRRGLLL